MILGAVAGDVIGSIYEWNPRKEPDIPLIDTRAHVTDDTILTLATAEAILRDRTYGEVYKEFGRRYPGAGYGGNFRRWLESDDLAPYNSFGNGSAMRISPVGWAFNSPVDVLWHAERSAEATHNHPEGVKGAQAVALGIFLARDGADKEELRRELTGRFGYDLDRSVAEIRPDYRFDVTCQGSVPEAIRCYLEANSVEEAIRLAVSLGGDADTQACIAGSLADASHDPLPEDVEQHVREALPKELLAIHDEFVERVFL
jgi:ADP-ribosylglycohydrolase